MLHSAEANDPLAPFHSGSARASPVPLRQRVLVVSRSVPPESNIASPHPSRFIPIMSDRCSASVKATPTACAHSAQLRP